MHSTVRGGGGGFCAGIISPGKISPPLQIPSLHCLPHKLHCESPQTSPGENFSTFLNEFVKQNYSPCCDWQPTSQAKQRGPQSLPPPTPPFWGAAGVIGDHACNSHRGENTQSKTHGPGPCVIRAVLGDPPRVWKQHLEVFGAQRDHVLAAVPDGTPLGANGAALVHCPVNHHDVVCGAGVHRTCGEHRGGSATRRRGGCWNCGSWHMRHITGRESGEYGPWHCMASHIFHIEKAAVIGTGCVGQGILQRRVQSSLRFSTARAALCRAKAIGASRIRMHILAQPRRKKSPGLQATCTIATLTRCILLDFYTAHQLHNHCQCTNSDFLNSKCGDNCRHGRC